MASDASCGDMAPAGKVIFFVCLVGGVLLANRSMPERLFPKIPALVFRVVDATMSYPNESGFIRSIRITLRRRCTSERP